MHHVRHSSSTSTLLREPQAQFPLIDEKSHPTAATSSRNISEPLVTISFQSVAEWPKSGEEINFVTVRRGVWISPGESSVP
jgi:hypothetical protein